ncbi:2-acylglycerophosphoethanolamine acyl transferase/acyl carrier [Chlamydia pneumoniae TW-183]|uniref:Aas bifunctional protein, putative n=2 Tax=Chlamydia pneumoniae TaxID=83558 RepID=Q9Z6Y4_CHLPN|nr:AMP-binding protein [Chlamydia pneumoniae]AAD19060.1 Acylglycerophosphoethanolamine Acyltransferase [Chlamydia pneumoniae CWL029]AAF38727.1 Aas bifunctional protein, putative [Chlamydia pneumoniae AR39]AAP98883.1 2-acylglycerophosphoethanolamine acyl transferase/acyl carrier [Chlamydia pneumoniae TW-183]ACZ32810.1 AMP-binding protein [Chlamydia pneumoniae LPCoLN]ETR79700.1 Acylglycerophosphoethanolamine acyltransferase [Chlamydia pneumoniae B21]
MHDQRNRGHNNHNLRLRPGSTLLEAFLILCSEHEEGIACFDEHLGSLSYRELRNAIIAVAIKVSKFSEDRVGVMMPASIGAFIAYFGILLAGKTPVMMNWSQGLRELRACTKTVEVRRVLTSQQFIKHLTEVQGFVEYPFDLMYMEDVRKRLSWWEKCRIGLYSKCSVPWLLRIFGVSGVESDDTAVILFTSGTEKLPKAVPLTHKNLMENQEACLKFFDPNTQDVMLAFLPPFHAYGFNSCGLFPLLMGVHVVFASNPLNPKKLVEFIDDKKVTFFGSTPVFFDYILKTAKKQNSCLESLRLVVIGGDALKDTLYEETKKLQPQIALYQGYGATECSPVISITTKESPRKSECVGMPIEGMDVLIISKETHIPVSSGEQGLIVVRGNSVFSGYLGNHEHQSFVSLGGDQWYLTGDLGHIGPSGDLFLEGRLSRFVKIGGEMVSLEALESILHEHFTENQNEDAGSLVVCGIPGDKVRLCLFTTLATTIHEVNDILKSAETSSIVKISYVHQVESIPILGIGKPDYVSLNALAVSLFG